MWQNNVHHYELGAWRDYKHHYALVGKALMLWMCFLEISYNELAFQVDRSHMWCWNEKDKIVLKLDLIMLTHEPIENLYV
jgi:hypothetical protein